MATPPGSAGIPPSPATGSSSGLPRKLHAASFRTHSFRGLAEATGGGGSGGGSGSGSGRSTGGVVIGVSGGGSGSGSGGEAPDPAALQASVRSALAALAAECGATGLAKLPVLPEGYIEPPPCLPPRTDLLPYPHEPPAAAQPQRGACAWLRRAAAAASAATDAPPLRCGEVDVMCCTEPAAAPCTPPSFRVAAAVEDDERTRFDRFMPYVLALFAAACAVTFLFALYQPEPAVVGIPPLAGLHGALVGLLPPPYGAINASAVTVALTARPRPAACTRADSNIECWPFDDAALSAVLNLSAPNAFFAASRYARAMYPGLWPAGALAASQLVFFDVQTIALALATLCLILVHLIGWGVTESVLVKGRRIPRARASPLFLYSRLAWPRRAAQTMISYQWGEATDLAVALAHILPHAWLDRFQLQVGDVINEQTTSACVHARLLVIILTGDYLARPNCCAELRAAALHRGEAHHTVVLLPPFAPRGADAGSGAAAAELPAEAAARRLRTRAVLAALPGFRVFDSVSDLLAFVDARVLNALDAVESARALLWWQTYGAPVRLTLAEHEQVGRRRGSGGAVRAQPVPSPAMLAQRWPLSHMLARLPCAAALACRLARPASHHKMFAGYAFLEDDAARLAMDYRPHPYFFVPAAALAPAAASLGLAAFTAVGLAATRLEGSKLLLCGVLLAVNAAMAALSVLALAPYARVSANVLAARPLLPLCFAACLESQAWGGGAAGGGSSSGSSSGSGSSGKGKGSSSGGGAGAVFSSSTATVPALWPAPAAARLRIIFVREAHAAAGSAGAAELAAMLSLPTKHPSEDAACTLFQPATLDCVLGNLTAFLSLHVGLAAEVCTLDDALGAGATAAPMAIYVFFVHTSAGLARWARASSDAAAWPAMQTVAVLPPFQVTSRAADGALLASLAILAGDKAHTARTSPHEGIAPAVLTAIAAKVSGVLLERLA